MDSNEFPELVQFLGGYFHQDFLLDYPNPDAAIAAYLIEAPQDAVVAACKELDQVIPLVERMVDAETFLRQVLGCYYYPQADGLTIADWLKQVRKKLTASGLFFVGGS